MSAASIHSFAPRPSEPYNGPREVFLLDRDLTKLETYVYSTIPHLALKKDLSDVEGRLDKKIETVRTEVEKVRTDLEKGQKENRAWLFGTTVAIIGVMIAIATFFGSREVQVAYVPQETTSALVSATQELVNATQELKELRNRLVEAERTNLVDEPSN